MVVERQKIRKLNRGPGVRDLRTLSYNRIIVTGVFKLWSIIEYVFSLRLKFFTITQNNSRSIRGDTYLNIK